MIKIKNKKILNKILLILITSYNKKIKIKYNNKIIINCKIYKILFLVIKRNLLIYEKIKKKKRKKNNE